MTVLYLYCTLQVADHPGAFVIAHGGFSRKVVQCAYIMILCETAVFEDLAVRQKRKLWSRVNYQETFAHTCIRFGHVRARVVYTTSRDLHG